MCTNKVILATPRLRQFAACPVAHPGIGGGRPSDRSCAATRWPEARGGAQPALITGTSTTAEPTGVTVARRKFEPASRTYWHSHPGGQLLLIEEGRALVQERGKPVRTLSPGESIFTGPNIAHWHGATPTQAMTQLNVGFPGGATKWMDPVTDAQYSGKTQ